VPIYRLYVLSCNRLTRWEDIEAEHDVAAIELARRSAGEHAVELWCEKRKITTFEQRPELARARRDRTCDRPAARPRHSNICAAAAPGLHMLSPWERAQVLSLLYDSGQASLDRWVSPRWDGVLPAIIDNSAKRHKQQLFS
jgi:hypothetical protein